MAVKLTDDEAMINNQIAPFSSTTNFSFFKFVNTRTKAIYYCNIHHRKFEMLPTNFWNGHGCPDCAKLRRIEAFPKTFKMKIRKSNEQVISEFQKIHGIDKYDYSKVNYTKNNVKVEIICKKQNHGVFLQTPNKHLLGRGCPICANATRNDNNKMTLDDFIKISNEIHNNFYDYSESIYKGALSYIDIICPEHGKFKQKVSDHIRGHGCKYCAQTSNRLKLFKTTSDIIDRAHEIHGDFYDYSKVDYKGINEPITIICPIHKEFSQIAHAHLRGAGCPKCNKSKGEKFVSKILDKLNIKYKEQYKFQDCKFKQPLPFDFYLLDYSICIEYQGEQHYVVMEHWGGLKSFEYLVNNDKIKKEFCQKRKIRLIEIPYTFGKEKLEDFLIREIGIK